MEKIISLDNKIRQSAQQKAAMVHKRKILAVRRAFQCTSCAAKCERCGGGIGQENPDHEGNPRIPYKFCSNCAEDYRDYIDMLQGKGDPEAYWHNHAWIKAWQTWIEYQGAVDNYLRSKEFRRLVAELNPESETD